MFTRNALNTDGRLTVFDNLRLSYTLHYYNIILYRPIVHFCSFCASDVKSNAHAAILIVEYLNLLPIWHCIMIYTSIVKWSNLTIKTRYILH